MSANFENKKVVVSEIEGYAKEAKVSTAGIRGPQNILYPQDTRFPINLVGIYISHISYKINTPPRCNAPT